MIRLCVLAAAGGLLATSGAAASDACSPFALEAKADVSVSDGASYQTHARYHLPNNNAFSILGAENQHYGVEGPYVWYNVEERVNLVGPAQKIFALGHQFHAMLLLFDEMMTNITPASDIAFNNGSYSGRRADFPYGGRVWLVDGETPERPAGMYFVFPGTTPIDAIYSDWQEVAGRQVPMTIEIIHQERRFTYSYTDVTIEDRSPLWFHESVLERNIDGVKVYRLHRKLMAAHCLGDAEMIGQLTTDETLVASRGSVSTPTGVATEARFEDYFSTVTHTAYRDLREPIIELSESGDIGWAAVNVGVEGRVNETGEDFANQWAWIMLVRNVGGEWKNAGNASNLKPE